eukprot:scaffold334816_cov59-Attheya_sp.AAC.3
MKFSNSTNQTGIIVLLAAGSVAAKYHRRRQFSGQSWGAGENGRYDEESYTFLSTNTTLWMKDLYDGNFPADNVICCDHVCTCTYDLSEDSKCLDIEELDETKGMCPFPTAGVFEKTTSSASSWMDNKAGPTVLGLVGSLAIVAMW